MSEYAEQMGKILELAKTSQEMGKTRMNEMEKILELEAELARTSQVLIELKAALTVANDKNITLFASTKRAAAKRASMDLTRKLTEFRKVKVY